MKYGKLTIIFGVVCLMCWTTSSAQTGWRKYDLSFLLGDNIGATTPVPVPGELKIKGYNPKINPKLGANFAYFFNEHWGAGTGLTLDWKGMAVKTRVNEVHLSIDVPNLGTLTGYVTGRNKTRVKTIYLTQPLYGVYRFNDKWQIRAGVYFAETLSRKFTGSVSDVQIVVESPLSQERDIAYATLDYSHDVRKFDFGLVSGGEFNLNRNFGFFMDMTWGLTPYFSGEVPIHFTMRNIYMSFGVTYRIAARR